MNSGIGTVISRNENPNPSKVDFIVNSGILHRGMYVEIDYIEGTMIALVENVFKTNRYFERAESVKEFESNGKNLYDHFPVTEWEYLVAEGRPLGVFKESLMKRPSFPPSPGTKVRIASNESLKRFLNFDESNGLNLGKIEFHDLAVKLNLTKLFQKHLAILAMSGSGKSFCTSALIEELLERKKEQGRIAAVLFDVHGEYTSFAEPVTDDKHSDYSSKTKVIKSREVKFGASKLSLGDFSAFIPDLSGAQKRNLGKVLGKLKQEMKEGQGPYNLTSIKNELKADAEIKGNTLSTLIANLNSLEETSLFSNVDYPNIEEFVFPGQLTVIDLSSEIELKRKNMIVAFFARKLFNLRRNHRVPPFTLILEEAHNFIPQFTSSKESISKSIFRTIAREGRKFGAGLTLISQRPYQLDVTTLSQCNTNIFMRITNPNDLKFISESTESIDKRSLDMITSLRVGEALIVGEAVSNPVFFKVRNRKSLPSRHEQPMEEAAKNYELNSEKEEKETENFL